MMLNTGTIPHPRPYSRSNTGTQDFSGYLTVPSQPRKNRLSDIKLRDIICTVALLTIVALAFLVG